MVLAQNGWSVSPSLDNRVVPGSEGVKLAPGVRSGDVATVLFYVAARLDLVVEKGIPGWCWGYNYRAIRGATSISNHAAGCAFDWNAPKHGLGQTGTWSIAQRGILQAIARDCRGVVRFGEFYEGRRDGMHVEVIAGPDKVADLAAMIRRGELPGGPDGTRGNDVAPTVNTAAILPPPVVLATVPKLPPVVEPGTVAPGFPLHPEQYFGPKEPLSNRNSVSGYFSHRDDLRLWQERMRYRGWTITADGYYGEETNRVAAAFQRDKSIACDGLVGPESWALAWTAAITR